MDYVFLLLKMPTLVVEENQSSSQQFSWEITCETTGTWKVTIKPFIHTDTLFIDIFSPLDIVASSACLI